MAATGNGSYWMRHWRGELSVSQAYWANTVGTNLIAGFIFLILGAVAGRLPLIFMPFYTGVFWLSVFILLIWQSVGVVRSAVRCIDDEREAWKPILALIALAVICANSVFAMIRVGGPQMSDAWNVLRGDPQWPDSLITVLPTGKEIEFAGAIKLHSADKLEKIFAEHPTVRILHLDTIGGRETEAIAMADLVRRKGVITYVGQQCASAGVIVFLAGKERILKDDAKLGFHSARAPGVPTDRANKRLENILTAAGADSTFINKALSTPPDTVWYPEPHELVEQGLATGVSDGTGYSLETRQITRYNEKGLREELDRVAKFHALAGKEPLLYSDALAHAAELIRKGSDMKTSLREVSDLMRQAMIKARPFASKAALDALVELDLEVLHRNMGRNPEETLNFLHHKSGKSVVPDYPTDADDRLAAALIASPLDLHAQAVDPPASKIWFLISEVIKSKEESALLGQIPEQRLEQIRACEVWMDFLRNLNRLPAEDELMLKRYLLNWRVAAK